LQPVRNLAPLKSVEESVDTGAAIAG
jgi:hypothetical protein